MKIMRIFLYYDLCFELSSTAYISCCIYYSQIWNNKYIYIGDSKNKSLAFGTINFITILTFYYMRKLYRVHIIAINEIHLMWLDRLDYTFHRPMIWGKFDVNLVEPTYQDFRYNIWREIRGRLAFGYFANGPSYGISEILFLLSDDELQI